MASGWPPGWVLIRWWAIPIYHTLSRERTTFLVHEPRGWLERTARGAGALPASDAPQAVACAILLRQDERCRLLSIAVQVRRHRRLVDECRKHLLTTALRRRQQ